MAIETDNASHDGVPWISMAVRCGVSALAGAARLLTACGVSSLGPVALARPLPAARACAIRSAALAAGKPRPGGD